MANSQVFYSHKFEQIIADHRFIFYNEPHMNFLWWSSNLF